MYHYENNHNSYDQVEEDRYYMNLWSRIYVDNGFVGHDMDIVRFNKKKLRRVLVSFWLSYFDMVGLLHRKSSEFAKYDLVANSNEFDEKINNAKEYHKKIACTLTDLLKERNVNPYFHVLLKNKAAEYLKELSAAMSERLDWCGPFLYDISGAEITDAARLESRDRYKKCRSKALSLLADLRNEIKIAIEGLGFSLGETYRDI